MYSSAQFELERTLENSVEIQAMPVEKQTSFAIEEICTTSTTFETTKDTLATMTDGHACAIIKHINPTIQGLTTVDVLVRGQHLIQLIPYTELKPRKTGKNTCRKLTPKPRVRHQPRKVISFNDRIPLIPLAQDTALISLDAMEERYEKQPVIHRIKAEMERLKKEVRMETFREQKILDRVNHLEQILEQEHQFLKQRELQIEADQKYRDKRKRRLVELEADQVEQKNLELEEKKMVG